MTVNQSPKEIFMSAFSPMNTGTHLPAASPPPPGAAGAFAQTRAALTLLADCYARQIYSSAIVAAVALRDAEFLRQWPGDLPDAYALRRLRVENRGALHRCLMAALRFQAEEKISAGALTRVDAAQLAAEAGRRIIMAAFVDSMELDGE